MPRPITNRRSDGLKPGIDAATFRRRYRLIALASWLLPPLCGIAAMMFFDIYTLEELVFVLSNIAGLYSLGFTAAAVWSLDRRAAALVARVAAWEAGADTGSDIESMASSLFRWHLFLFVMFALFGPTSAELSLVLLRGGQFSAGNFLYGMVAGIPPLLIVALPIFFLLTDTMGAYLAPRGVRMTLVPMRIKILALGLATPALVDMTMLLYFRDRTGYFTRETVLVWALLMAVAAFGAFLAWRSLRQGLSPFFGRLGDGGSLVPESLDELGEVVYGWRQALDRGSLSEARYRNLVEGSIQGVYIHRDFRLLFANRTFARMLGYDSPEDLLAKGDVLDFVHPDEHARVLGYKSRRAIGEPAPETYELRMLRRDGRVIWIENNARVVDWEGGPAIQATNIDITERKASEDALRHSEALLKNAQRIGRLGGWVWDIEAGTLKWSDEIYRIFGFEPDAFPATYEAFLDRVHPDDRRIVTEGVARALDGTAPYNVDHRIVLPDGAERIVHEQGEVIRDTAGKPVRMDGTVQDVTEQRRTEEALRQSETSLNNAQRIARIGSWERDLTTGTLFWSDTMYDLFGVEKTEVKPSVETVLDHTHRSDRSRLKRAIADAIAGKADYNLKFRIFAADGQARILHAQGEVARNASGQPMRFSGTAQDVTELHAAEERARRLNDELEERVALRTRELRETQAELIKKERLATLGQLTATVSHELRNPLGAMRTSAYVLAQSLADGDPRVLRAVERIERSIERCDRIIDELLDFTRSRVADRLETDIDAWLTEVLGEQTVPAGATLRREAGLAGVTAAIDPDSMRRVIINLLENAFQAMPEAETASRPRQVTVTTRPSRTGFEIEIADTGPGIAPDVLPRIFEPLFSTKSFGVGLGLPTVRHVVEQHEGSIDVDTVEGEGCRFIIRLPLAPRDESDPAGPVEVAAET